MTGAAAGQTDHPGSDFAAPARRDAAEFAEPFRPTWEDQERLAEHAGHTGLDHAFFEDRGAVANGRAKLARKGCDLLVVNEVGAQLGFESSDNAAVILGADGSETVVPRGPKDRLAHVVWDLVVARLPGH